MMVGLVILKYIECLSDEKLISRCTHDHYYQAFIGRTSLVKTKPCDRTLLSVFRKRIGKEGAEIILQDSIVINGKLAVEEVKKELIIDSTVQEKFSAFPTDTKLALDVIHQCWRIATLLHIKFRVKFEFEVNKLRKDSAFNKSKNQKEVRETNLVRLREIGLILLNELNKKIRDKLVDENKFDFYYKTYYKVLTQNKNDSNKIYSVFKPQIYCIAKGKQNKKYEFGTKVVVVVATA
jgi:IS5 family transposase